MGWAEGRTGIVTGAASGIGRASAERLAREGAHVILVDLNESGLAETIAAIEGAGGTAQPVSGDVSAGETWDLVSSSAHRNGRLVSFLHSNAYVHHPGGPSDIDEEQWDHVFAVNVRALYLAVTAMHSDLAETSGSIIVTSSVHSRFGLPGYTAYAASKGALDAAVRQLAVELAPRVRVNSVVPGPVATAVWDGTDHTSTATATALLRLGRAEEVAAVVNFLASPEASFMTGANVVVDGGWSVKKDSL